MNNKIIIAIVILLTVGIFVWLVNYGWQNRYGSPETYEVIVPEALTVGYYAEGLALKEADIFDQIWKKTPGIEVTLNHQITEKPWPKGLTPAVQVQAFHDGKDIYFKMTWEDDHADSVKLIDTFVDGCAVAIPIDTDAPVRSIMMGFSSPVNIWQWQANADMRFWQKKTGAEDVYADFVYPFEDEETLSVSNPELKSAVTDMLAQRVGSLTSKNNQIVQGRGLWREGRWNVIFKRLLTTEDLQHDSQFSGAKQSVSFAVWDGDQDDRGSRKSISEWINLDIQSPPSEKSADEQTFDDTRNTEGYKASWIEKLCSFSLVSTAYGATGGNESARAAQKSRVIDIVAKRFEYTPNRISLKKGELVTLRMESLDVTHGLYLDGYEINIKARPGLIGKATFVADKPGRFSFRCSETCGEFHPYMIGFLEITPNTRFSIFLWAIGIAFVLILGLVLCRGKQENGVKANVAREQ
jgi:DMSO reductase family type II enzyme heme b subunit